MLIYNGSEDDIVTNPDVAVAEEMSDEEQEAFLEEVGTIIFKSTVLRYLNTIPDEEAEHFEVFIKEHSESENFIDELTNKYPEFKFLLDEEMEAFQKELS